ncbi:hypothetical protein TrRE_jg6535 [Triparma retinervis]|uniref:Uncharacterized protein n=1 Tax=Triparma retinervis TaxID=2557542 RepID=A0A9W7DPV8_9STRA|nr:hypothetical protein TrRE_jg6535 [Triparma retinervis]
MTSVRGSTRLNRTLEVASSLQNTITALVERNGCKFSTTLDLKKQEMDEEGHVVIPSAQEQNPFAPRQEVPQYTSIFVAPEHKTLHHPSKTYQLDQVEHLPPNGMLSDSDNDTDEEQEEEVRRRFNHSPLAQSPFKASGKLSVHNGREYSSPTNYQVEMVQGLPDGEWAGEEVGFSLRLGDEEGDSDDDDERDRILADFAAVEAQVEREDKREQEEKKEVKRGKKKVQKKKRLVDEKTKQAEMKDVVARDISTAETDKTTEEEMTTQSTTNTAAIGSSANHNHNDTVLSAINWGMTREEMDEIAKNYNGPMTSPAKVKTKKKEKPFCNYKKYQEMQKETKGGDWYVFQDGSPYVSKWEEMRAKEKGDPEKLMDPGGFRRFFGKQSEWHVHEFGIRNSSTYEGHADEAGLVDGRDDKKLKHKWIDNKGWSGIGTSIKPHWGRRNAKGYSGMHGNINENTTHSEFGAHVAQHSAQGTEKS